ncbi:MAG: hypothetical protein AB1Z55_03990 [Acidimicrobiia bacterium]
MRRARIQNVAAWMVALAVVVAGCGADTAAPTVAIDSVEVDGRVVELGISTSGDDLAFTVDWGDGTDEIRGSGQGPFVFDHAYGPDVGTVTIAVEATAPDGLVGRATRQVVVGPSETTTSTAPETTTTTASETTTTVGDSTATTSSTSTTTTSTSTPTSTSTTTTLPETTTTTVAAAPQPVEISLAVRDAAAVTSSNNSQSTWDGRVAKVFVERAASTPEVESVRLTWEVDTTPFRDLDEVVVTLRLDSVFALLLETDRTDGNRAEIRYSAFLISGGTTVDSDSEVWSAGADDRINITGGMPLEVSGRVSPASPLRYRLEVACEAVGPSGLALLSKSICDGRYAGWTINGIGGSAVAP